jgi:hypothetical protein
VQSGRFADRALADREDHVFFHQSRLLRRTVGANETHKKAAVGAEPQVPLQASGNARGMAEEAEAPFDPSR